LDLNETNIPEIFRVVNYEYVIKILKF